MLHLILADSELEQVPPEIAGHPVIRRLARRKGRRPTELILNSSLHFPAMRKLQDWERRGRPDIVHMVLLTALDTPLNREGLLRIYIHTRKDKLITVSPSVNLPRASYRFEGLMEQLFLTGKVPQEKPFLRVEDASLETILQRISPEKVITFSDRGNRRLWSEIYRGLSLESDVCVVIGGFSRGDFLSDVDKISDELVCIDPELLRAPTVVGRAIYSYEDTFGISELRWRK